MICSFCGKEISTNKICYNCRIAFEKGKIAGKEELMKELRQACGLK